MSNPDHNRKKDHFKLTCYDGWAHLLLTERMISFFMPTDLLVKSILLRRKI